MRLPPGIASIAASLALAASVAAAAPACSDLTFGRAPTFYPAGPPAADSTIFVAKGDLDGDGHPDLLVARPGLGAIVMLPGDGAGGFGPARVTVTGGNPVLLRLGDFDGDGRLDVVVQHLDGA